MADYARMQTATKAAFFHGRSKTPPTYATDVRKIGELLARYFELRAGIYKPSIGSTQWRLVRAQKKILASLPHKAATLDKLSLEYVTLKNAGTDPDRQRELERQIRTLDGELVIESRGPFLIVGVINYFLRCGYNSSETSTALHGLVSPVNVRRIAARLTKLWEKMQNGTDAKPTKSEVRRAKHRARWREKDREKQLPAQKDKRDAETPEQRATRLQYARDYYYAHHDRIRAQQKIERRFRRAEALQKYRAMTPEQIEERRRKARIYAEKNREKLLADDRRRRAARLARMTPEQKAILHERQKAYRDTHREQIAERTKRWREKKRAMIPGRAEERTSS